MGSWRDPGGARRQSRPCRSRGDVVALPGRSCRAADVEFLCRPTRADLPDVGRTARPALLEGPPLGRVLIHCLLTRRRFVTEAPPSRPAPWRATTYPTARSARKPTIANDVPAIMAKLRATPEESPQAVSRSPRAIP